MLVNSCCNAGPEFSVAPQYGEGMILPKCKTITVAGTGSGPIKVEMAGNVARCRAKGGAWEAELPAMEAGGPYVMTVTNKGKSIEIGDVYVGSVIIFAGQSNLQFKLADSNTPKEEWQGDSLMRSFSLQRLEEGDPFSPADGWVRCTEENAGGWSAIGYLAASELRKRTGEAVGVVNCYQGASVIETWMPAEIVAKPEYQLPDSMKHIDHFNEYFKTWNQPGLLYQLDVKYFAPYPVSGVVWYQGESNAGRGEYKIYPAMFADMAAAWREDFKDGNLPFIVIQIADFIHTWSPAWTELQESQLAIPSLSPNTVVVRSADVCENDDIHPKSKGALSVRVVDAFLNFNN